MKIGIDAGIRTAITINYHLVVCIKKLRQRSFQKTDHCCLEKELLNLNKLMLNMYFSPLREDRGWG